MVFGSLDTSVTWSQWTHWSHVLILHIEIRLSWLLVTMDTLVTWSHTPHWNNYGEESACSLDAGSRFAALIEVDAERTEATNDTEETLNEEVMSSAEVVYAKIKGYPY